jgi:hypothetical protein
MLHHGEKSFMHACRKDTFDHHLCCQKLIEGSIVVENLNQVVKTAPAMQADFDTVLLEETISKDSKVLRWSGSHMSSFPSIDLGLETRQCQNCICGWARAGLSAK